MSKRLQVVMDDKELRAVKRAARAEQLTVSDWVRRALRDALCKQSQRPAHRKLQSIRAAVQHQFPAPDVEQMNAEIAQGYAQSRDR